MESFKNKDAFLEGKNIVLGLSGGVDSVVLLHYLHAHYPNKVRAVHCNHHLSVHCDEWQTFCADLCASLGVAFKNIHLSLEKSSNMEENARKSRYLSLSSELKKDEVLCTAHHKNDQAETLLLQLFRGSGVAGLASMPKSKTFGKGLHYRPLLNIEKSEIIQYAKDKNLAWVEDDSNADINFRRNFLRLNILPKLEMVYQNLANTLSRSAKHQSESLHLTQDLAQADIEQQQLIAENRINVKRLMQFKAYRIKNILRYHLTNLEFLIPSDKVMWQILNLLSAKKDAIPLVSWGEFEIRRYQDELYFIDTRVIKNTENCPYYNEFKGLPNFSIFYRIKGQRVKLPNKTHSQSLKKILQEFNIPPWERETLRMYYINNKLHAMECIGYMKDD